MKRLKLDRKSDPQESKSNNEKFLKIGYIMDSSIFLNKKNGHRARLGKNSHLFI